MSPVTSAANPASATGVKKGSSSFTIAAALASASSISNRSSDLTSVAVGASDIDVANRSSAHTSAFLPATPSLLPNAPPDGPFPSTVQRKVDIELVDENASVLNAIASNLNHFNYISAYDKLLVKCVRENDAHNAGNGNKMKAFEHVRFSFLKRMPSAILCERQ